ncbi:hypothetical protein H6787_00135 [Candidatus Nomurabacteria bacterium]|nr:hypothetical protein [Candidatus Nomurabacteria bacterium]
MCFCSIPEEGNIMSSKYFENRLVTLEDELLCIRAQISSYRDQQCEGVRPLRIRKAALKREINALRYHLANFDTLTQRTEGDESPKPPALKEIKEESGGRNYDPDFAVNKDGVTREDFNTVKKNTPSQAMVA